MGMRPSLLLVCGTEAKENDERFDVAARQKFIVENAGVNGWLGDILVPPLFDGDDKFDLITGHYIHDEEHYKRDRKYFGDVLHRGSPASGVCEHSPIVGYVIDRVCRNDIVYALMALFEKQFGGKGYLLYPRRSKEENPSMYRAHCNRYGGKDETDLAIKEGRWIEFECAWKTDYWFRCAIHVLHLAGWTGITRDMLKIVVIAQWS